MRLISTIAVVALSASLAGCVSYSKHEREERVIEHRSGGYRAERYDRHGGSYGHDHYRHRHDHDRHDHDRHHDGGHDRHHPRGH